MPRTGSPERGLQALYFAYFAYVGGFTPYLSLYLAERQLSAAQIGVLMTLPQALRIVAPPVWGRLADRARNRTRWLLAGALSSALVMLALPLGGADPLTVGAVLAALFFATAGQMPIAEAMALSVAQGDPGRYGRMRVWGSIGFIGAVIAIGPLLDALGTSALPACGALLLGVLTFVATRLREVPRAPAALSHARVRQRLRERPIAGFFASAFLMIFAHATFYAYFSLYLEQHGYSKTAIGLVWALGVLAEIVLFRWQRPLFARFGAARLLSASLLVAAVRFAAIGAADGAWPWIVATQLMHAVTFGVHHSASMALLHRWFGEAQQARAQALFVTIAYGLGGTAGGLYASYAWSHWGAAAAFIGSGVVALAGWAASLACRRDALAPARSG